MTGESQTPQFATAEYAATHSSMKCAVCKQAIGGSYYQINGAPVCAACTEKIRAQIPKDSHAAFVCALVFGIAGALVGLVLYVVFALATGLIIGYVSLAVGYIVGKAMHLGSRGVSRIRQRRLSRKAGRAWSCRILHRPARGAELSIRTGAAR